MRFVENDDWTFPVEQRLNTLTRLLLDQVIIRQEDEVWDLS